MRKFVLAALAAWSPAAAQPLPATEMSDLVGHWSGPVTEMVDGRTLHYSMTLDIAVDREGNPVGSVAYDLGCNGVWVADEGVHEVWIFQETITAGLDHCAPQILVELVQAEGTLRVRLINIDVHHDGVARYYEEAGEATLRRR